MKQSSMGLLSSLVLVAALSACGEKAPQPQAKQHFVKPPEQVLAVLEAGAEVDINSPSVSRFRSLLDSVSARCINSRDEITSSLIEIQTVLEQKGVNITLSELLERINTNMSDLPPEQRVDFDKVAASFHGLASTPPATAN